MLLSLLQLLLSLLLLRLSLLLSLLLPLLSLSLLLLCLLLWCDEEWWCLLRLVLCNGLSLYLDGNTPFSSPSSPLPEETFIGLIMGLQDVPASPVELWFVSFGFFSGGGEGEAGGVVDNCLLCPFTGEVLWSLVAAAMGGARFFDCSPSLPSLSVFWAAKGLMLLLLLLIMVIIIAGAYSFGLFPWLSWGSTWRCAGDAWIFNLITLSKMITNYNTCLWRCGSRSFFTIIFLWLQKKMQ